MGVHELLLYATVYIYEWKFNLKIIINWITT